MALSCVMVLTRVLVLTHVIMFACVMMFSCVLLLAHVMVLITDNLIQAQRATERSGRQWNSYFVYYGLKTIILLSDHN